MGWDLIALRGQLDQAILMLLVFKVQSTSKLLIRRRDPKEGSLKSGDGGRYSINPNNNYSPPMYHQKYSTIFRPLQLVMSRVGETNVLATREQSWLVTRHNRARTRCIQDTLWHTAHLGGLMVVETLLTWEG